MKLQPITYSEFQRVPEEIQEALLQSGAVVVNDKYLKLYQRDKKVNIVVLIGGRGGAKTNEGSRYVTLMSCHEKKRTAILRDEHSLVRESILNEIFLRYDELTPYWNFEAETQKLDTGIKGKDGSMMVFTKGFRASSKAKKANLKGVSDIDIALVEELEDIRDEEMFNTFADSIRKPGSLIIIMLNTPDINHWLMKRLFIMEPVPDLDGYFNIIPKDIPGVLVIKTTFEDNPYMAPHKVDDYRNYGNPNSHLYNPHYYYTSILGYASTGRKGQIIKKAQKISLKDYLALPFKEHYAQDWGTAKPAALGGFKMDGPNIYCRQLNYLPMAVKDIAKLYCTLGITLSDVIIGDSAEPGSISKIRRGFPAEELTEDERLKYPQLLKGWTIYAAHKYQGSIKDSISILEGMNIYVVEESTDFWNEIYNYVYAQDKNMNYTNEPIDDFNHLIDGLRYIVLARGRQI